MKNKKIVCIVSFILFATFAILAFTNYFNPAKLEAERLEDEYFNYYLECQSIWSDCLDIGYDSGAYQAKQLMESWQSRMNIQKSIIESYNEKAIVCAAISAIALAGGAVVFLLDKKGKKQDFLCEGEGNNLN